ncbi:alpha-L-fucosidase [Thelonectria olida]|uniref:Alpha-L-fucosidase n=1 Tax=Thelonectria olida TaxID=1576542 RepID=A0A9P9AUT9_9HYPO|nr:alpha-L-fucosidase [Thelonectria olida]
MTPEDQHLHLHYSAPSTEWAQALPIGNGRLGAMIHGRPSTELWQLNEDSVWYGGPQDRTPRDAFKHLGTLRQLIRDEKHAEAEELVRTAFFATPASMRHYEPLGSCHIEFKHQDVTNYRRALDVGSAVHTVKYQHDDGVAHERQSFASFPDSVLLTRVTSSEPVRFVIRLTRVGEQEWDSNEFLDSIHSGDERIVLHATPGGRDSNRLCMVLGVKVSETGSVVAIGNSLVVQASSCIIAIGAHTTYRHADPELEARRNVDAALSKTWDQLVDAHVQDYRALFGRISLRLWPDASNIPTDHRIKHLRDPGLVALYHNYGRYLLISSSRDAPKALPANLQGIWNPSFSPPWGGKYTININLQMNYWPVGPTGLHECALPLLDLLERMAVRGRQTAKAMYGCRGWCAHHNTDIWADTDPADRWMPSTLWPLGGVWLCVEAMDKLEYHWDPSTLRRIAVLLEGCIEFILDFLTLSKDGKHLVTSPSVSPENTFMSSDGALGILCEGSTIDTSIISVAFRHYLECHKNLSGKMRDDLAQKVSDILHPPNPLAPRLSPIAINQDSLIQEWGLNNYAEHEPGHRHVSHLFALYPGKLIHPDTAPGLSAAAKKVLERRAAHGGGHTGWSRAWLLSLHARLRDAKGCGLHMEQLLSGSTLPNMLDNHPPFQIDGNFGGCAGIVECLVQSKHHHDERGRYVGVHLLPACPVEWSSGHVQDVRVSGWLALTFSWEEGKITDEVTVVLKQPSMIRIGVRVGALSRGFTWLAPGEAGEAIKVKARQLYE